MKKETEQKGRQWKDKELEEEIRTADKQRQRNVDQTSLVYKRIVGNIAGRGEDKQVTPYLLIRSSLTDYGIRPLPSGSVFWQSPDIWVDSSSPLGNPVAGEDNFVHARIFNLGAFDAAPVKADFYWADPSTGLGASNMIYIGSKSLEVKSQHSVDFKCPVPWVPEYLNDGHECLMVNCSSWLLSPIHDPFEPTLDCQVGQSNLHVEEGRGGQTLGFSFYMNNLLPFPASHQISVNVNRIKLNARGLKLPFRELLGKITQGDIKGYVPAEYSTKTTGKINNRQRNMHTVTRIAEKNRGRDMEGEYFTYYSGKGSDLRLSYKVHEQSAIVATRCGSVFLNNRLRACNQTNSNECRSQNEFVLHSLDLEANEQKKVSLDITIPSDAVHNEIFILNLSQNGGGYVLGGYTYLIKVRK